MNPLGIEGPPGSEIPASKGPEALRIRMLGGFGVSVGSRVIEGGEWRLRKAAALLKMLALAPGHRLHREQAMDLLWPDLGKEAAANNLRQVLHAARRTLAPDRGAGPRYLGSEGESLVLCPEGGDLWVDVEAFEGAALAARRGREPGAYEAAIDLYAGELLPDDRYEGWAEERRRELAETHASLLLGLARAHEERGDYGSAIGALRTAATNEPANEAAHAGLMRLYALSGNLAGALGQYELLEETVLRELGTGPGADARALREEIASGRFPSGASQPLRSPSSESSEPPRHNLPAPRTSFVDRVRELAEVKRALAMTRLLTLTGAGGSGKTRLALEAAADLAGAYPDGVRLVELAGLSEPALVPQEVADALGVRERPGRPLMEVVAEDVGEKTLLLVSDNCEHLAEAAARMLDFLLARCPRLKVMATSRELLGVEGEALFPVPPLPVPATSTGSGGTYPVEVAGNDAVRLFVDRARLRLPGFSLAEANARPVAEVCRRLEGIPLAIELAAARMGTLATEQVAERLENSLGLLSAGPRTAPPRQRTMRAAIGWSFGLLREEEKVVFGRLSAFRDGFALEAAEAVCPGGVVEDGEVLGLVSGLVDKSLVVAETTGEGRVRYRLLEPVRQYAREKLQESGDSGTVLRRHAEFFLALAEEAEPELKGPGQEAWLGRLEAEHENLRAALSWALEQDEAELGLRLGSALAEFWHLHVHHSEAQAWLEAALARHTAPSRLRMKALERASFLTWEQGDYRRAVALGDEALVLARRHGDDATAAAVLVNLGSVAMSRTDVGRASALLEEALALWRGLGDERGLALTLFTLGMVALVRRDHDRAMALHEGSLALARKAGNEVGIVQAMGLGALAALIIGDHAQAEALAEKAIEMSGRLGIEHFAISLLHLFGASAALQDRPVRAVRLWSAEIALREAMGIPRMPAETYFYKPYVDAVRAQLDEATWERARSEGQAMDMERAIEYALSEKDDGPSTPQVPEEHVGAGSTPLTRREEEVAALVARGLTNRQIAAELSVSEHTAANHVARIRRKLGLGSRSQVAVWATKGRPLP